MFKSSKVQRVVIVNVIVFVVNFQLKKGVQEFQGRCLKHQPNNYYRVFMSDFSITSHTIVTVGQRTYQRVKSESSLSDSFERQRSSRRSLKERASLFLSSKRSFKDRKAPSCLRDVVSKNANDKVQYPLGFLVKALTLSQNRSAVNCFLNRSFHLLQLIFCYL